MGRPFIVYVNLSNILKDQKETHYTMYIDDTKMSIVLELVEWIRWIFSLTHCVYVTHENSVIHELEDINILSVLRTIKVENCNHFPCVHTNFNYLFKKLSLFAKWDGIEVPKLFLNKANEISRKFIQKDIGPELTNGHNEKEATATSNERKVESNKIKDLCSSNISTCENQLSKNLTCNMYGNNKTNFNINSSIKLDETVVKIDGSDKVHSILSAKSESVHVKSTKNANFMGLGKKSYDVTIPADTALEMKNSNTVQSVLPDENEYVNAPIEISESEIEQIKSLVDINLSANTEDNEDNEDEETNKSNQKGMQSILNDKKLNCNKIIKKGAKPFSVGEILTSLRNDFNTSSNSCEPNTFSTEYSQNCPNELINDRLECSDQNSPNDIDVLVTKIKRKRIRRHRPKRLMSKGPRFDSTPKHEGGYTSECFTSYTPYQTKQSNHIRFTSDDEDFSETNNCKLDKESEKTQHDLSKNNASVENGVQPSLINGKEETFSMSPPNACNKNDESKEEDSSEANKEFSTLDKLMLLHDQKTSSDSLYGFLSEENQEINDVAKTPDNYDFNLSTLKALKEKFPSPMVVERFY